MATTPISDGYAQDLLARYTRQANQPPSMFPLANGTELIAYWNKNTPSWWLNFKKAVTDSNLDVNALHQLMTDAAIQDGGILPQSPATIFKLLAERTDQGSFIETVMSELRHDLETVSATTETALKAASNVLSIAPYLYVGASLVGLVLMMRALGGPSGKARSGLSSLKAKARNFADQARKAIS